MDIPPLNDRLVLFSSQHLAHRVLPSSAERCCFTIWLSAGGRPQLDGGGGGAEREAARRALARPEPPSERGCGEVLGEGARLALLQAAPPLTDLCMGSCHVQLPRTHPCHVLCFTLHTSDRAGAEEAWRLLLHPELRKHAIKYAHRQEWERSLRESHPAGPELQQALATFRREVAVIERALVPLLPALAAGPPPGTPPPAWF